MTTALIVAPALLLGGVLIASGLLKLRTPADLREFDQLGVPAPLRRLWIARLHPWAETALGILLWLTGGWLGTLAAIAATVLMGSYLALVVRARRAAPDASCACFGTSKTITAVTIARNAWLLLLAVLAVATSWTFPVLGGPVNVLGADGWAAVALAAGAAVTVALITWPEPPASPSLPPEAAPASFAEEADELDYVRTITPAIPVAVADGTTRTLRQLSSQRPQLLLAVSPTCGSCTTTIGSRERWRGLLPELDIRLLLNTPVESSELIEAEGVMSLHDAERWVAPSLGYSTTPSAVLLGVDGLLAGGPISGAEAIEEFVGDIYESLHGVRPPAV